MLRSLMKGLFAPLLLLATPALAQNILVTPNGKDITLGADDWVSITHEIPNAQSDGLIPAPRKYGTTGKWFYNVNNINSIAITNSQVIKYQGPCAGRFCYSLPSYVAPVVEPEVPPVADVSPGRNFPTPAKPVMGVNLAGCTFVSNGALCPTPASVNAYIDKGFGAIRYPFYASQMNTPAIALMVSAAADAAVKRGVIFILDRHDYGDTFAPEQVPFWAKLMATAGMPWDSPLLMVDTMNEPKTGAPYVPGADGKSYASEVNAGIAAFRAAGFNNPLLIEWRGWSANFRFDKNEGPTKACETPSCSFDRYGALTDPIGKTILNAHRYLDSGSSGTSATCVAGTSVNEASAAARERGYKMAYTEMAFGSAKGVPASCVAPGAQLITDLNANADVIPLVTWWGGGAGWKEDYFFKIEPTKGTFATTPLSDYGNQLLGK